MCVHASPGVFLILGQTEEQLIQGTSEMCVPSLSSLSVKQVGLYCPTSFGIWGESHSARHSLGGKEVQYDVYQKGGYKYKLKPDILMMLGHYPCPELMIKGLHHKYHWEKMGWIPLNSCCNCWPVTVCFLWLANTELTFAGWLSFPPLASGIWCGV